VATARSYTRQEAAGQSAGAGSSRSTDGAPPAAAAHAWNVLAQLPTVSVEDQPEPEVRISSASAQPTYRFDLPESPRPPAAIEAFRPGGQTAAADRGGAKANYSLTDATVLPLWRRPAHDPAESHSGGEAGAKQASRWASSLARFLLLAALFTAAGLSLRMMFTTSQVPATPPVETPVVNTDHSAAVPATDAARESAAPLPETPAEDVASLPVIAEQAPAAPNTSPTIATEEVPVERLASQGTAKVVYPITLQTVPTKNAHDLTDVPHAAESSAAAPAIAQLPGYILEVPPRQAQQGRHEADLH
jgi:hypothetical protein